MFLNMEKYTDAPVRFEKAGTLDPDQEKAFRYAGDTLLRLDRRDNTLDQYISAVVAIPCSQYSWSAL